MGTIEHFKNASWSLISKKIFKIPTWNILKRRIFFIGQCNFQHSTTQISDISSQNNIDRSSLIEARLVLQCRLEYVGENSVGQNILSERNILSDRMCREEEQKRIRSAEQCVARSYKQYIYYIDKLSISKYRINDQELDSSEKGGKWDIYFHILSIIL